MVSTNEKAACDYDESEESSGLSSDTATIVSSQHLITTPSERAPADHLLLRVLSCRPPPPERALLQTTSS
ncbi:hypothetical protein PBY51_016476 [Eleginops maclovinus]|uniref:Uncharacterized protein n=1 Tax=Eleginops maclovinus TaxID=56733 RepID=A0AAN8AJV6_ELEMC|nr:hypothetical protein PBY51_016476 [Eleginops maclovinus]